ncbi:MAG: hypothetical protein J6M12_02575 [Clostridia bacterium]|nr:hypothetical protein [Clostridia bacterium]
MAVRTASFFAEDNGAATEEKGFDEALWGGTSNMFGIWDAFFFLEEDCAECTQK